MARHLEISVGGPPARLRSNWRDHLGIAVRESRARGVNKVALADWKTYRPERRKSRVKTVGLIV